MRQFAKYTVWKLLTCDLNLKDEIGDLSNTVEGLDDNIQDNSAKIKETENLAQNLVDLNNTISVKMQESETLVENHVHDLNDLQDTVHDLNNTVRENAAKIKGIYFRSALILQIHRQSILHICSSLQPNNHFHIITIYSCLHSIQYCTK